MITLPKITAPTVFIIRGKLSLSNNLYGIITGADTLGGKVKKLVWHAV
jgi:hypothetical protein